MQKFVAIALILCLALGAPAAHAGKLKKLVLIGGALVAAKAIAKKKDKQRQQPQDQGKKNGSRDANR